MAYFEARNRILEERLLDGMRLVTRKVKKARERFKRRRQIKRLVVEAVARSAQPDPRVFAEFSLGGRQMRGLLDSGASESLLGRGCRELAEELDLPVKPYVSIVRTASGEDRSIIGRMVVPVEYKGEIRQVEMYLCPYLEQTAYLEIDFWRIFGIAPEVVGSKVPVVAAIEKTQGMTKQVAHYVKDGVTRYEPEAWEPEESQKLIVEEVNFKEVGLGKTHAEKHRIEWPAERPIADSLEWAWAYDGRGRLRATLDTDTSPMPTKICATSLDKSGINLRSGVASGSGRPINFLNIASVTKVREGKDAHRIP
ncbi:hypothetical protein ACLKA7_001867 [Drosophila subpalustris]